MNNTKLEERTIYLSWQATDHGKRHIVAELVEKDLGSDPVEFTHFYPYQTSYTQVDERYAFDDDPLTAFVHEPYTMQIEVVRVTVRRSMVRPRTQFVDEMYRSADRL